MTAATDASAAESQAAALDPSASNRALWIGLFVGVASVRFVFTLVQRMPDVAHDEFAQMAVARVVSGAGHWSMFDLATWQPGFGLLISPIAVATGDPSRIYAGALLANCLIGGAGAVAIAQLIRRAIVSPVATPIWSASIAGAIALSPGLIRTSAFAWAEPSLVLIFSLALLLTLRFQQEGATADALLAVVLAAIGYLFHGRMLAVLGAVTAAAAVIAWNHSKRATLQIVAVGVAAYAAVSVVSTLVIDLIWEVPSNDNTVGGTLARLTEPDQVLLAASGQLWYLLVSSLGVFGLGVIVVVGAGMRRRSTTSIIRAEDARLISVIVGAPMAVSAVFMAGRTDRADFSFYGRYNDSVSAVVIAVGAAALLHWSATNQRRRLVLSELSVVSAAAIGVALLRVTRGEVVANRTIFRTMVAGIIPFQYGPPRGIVLITLLAMGLFVGVSLVVWRYRNNSITAALLGVLLLAGALRIYGSYENGRNVYERLETVTAIETIVPEGATIGVDLPPETAGADAFTGSRVELNGFQFFLPDYSLVSLSALEGPPEYWFGLRDSSVEGAPGAFVVWDEPGLRMVLWQQ